MGSDLSGHYITLKKAAFAMKIASNDTGKSLLSAIVPIEDVQTYLQSNQLSEVRKIVTQMAEKIDPADTAVSFVKAEQGVERQFHDNFKTGLSIMYARSNIQRPELINIRVFDVENPNAINLWADENTGIYQGFPAPKDLAMLGEISAFRQRKNKMQAML